MSGTLKPVRFILAWQTYSVGDEITPNATHRDWLINNGYCELVPDKKTITSKAKVLTQAVGAVMTR